MSTRFISSCLHSNEGIPLTRQKLVTENIAGSISFEYSVTNVDDLIYGAPISCEGETPQIAHARGVCRISATSLDDAVQQHMRLRSLPESIAKLSKQVYSDSRALEFSYAVELQSFFLEVSSTHQETSDPDGFITVTSGYKPAMAHDVAISATGLADFYKFQLKERKLKEWQTQKSRKLSAERDVVVMAKRRKFDL